MKKKCWRGQDGGIRRRWRSSSGTQRERRERVYREYPRVQEIDQQLRRTMAEFMAETFRNGQTPGRRWSCCDGRIFHLQQERRDILRRSGYGENYLNDGPMCRLCSDTGYVGEKMCSCLEKYCQEEQRKTLTSLLSCQSQQL